MCVCVCLRACTEMDSGHGGTSITFCATCAIRSALSSSRRACASVVHVHTRARGRARTCLPTLPSNEMTLFTVRRDSGGTISLIMSHGDIDGCWSILVFTMELVPLPLVAVDTGASC